MKTKLILYMVCFASLFLACQKKNTKPEILQLQASQSEIMPGDTIQISCLAADAEKDSLEFDWKASDGMFTGPVSACKTSWKSPAETGEVLLTVTVSDGKSSVSKEINIMVKRSTTPVEDTPEMVKPEKASPISENSSPSEKPVNLPQLRDPVADFSMSKTEARVMEEILFSDQSTESPAGWSWDFGDGTTSSEQNPGKSYTKPGKYIVSLTVSNQSGSSSKSAEVIAGTPPQADFSVTKSEASTGEAVQFTDKSTGSVTSWNWDFGNGSTSTGQNPNVTYQAKGIYTVKLTVTNSFGNDTKTMTDIITVKEPVTSVPDPAPETKLEPGASMKMHITANNITCVFAAGNVQFTVSGAAPKETVTATYTIKEITEDLDLNKESDKVEFVNRYQKEIKKDPDLRKVTIVSPRLKGL